MSSLFGFIASIYPSPKVVDTTGEERELDISLVMLSNLGFEAV